MVGIEEIAQRNQLMLYRASRPGQWKAHCPVCGDRPREFHLYVNTDKDAFYCHKCGTKGGAIAFHAWLRRVPFETAKEELYPPQAQSPKITRRNHPAEQLTKAQLSEIGFTLRTPRKIAPAGVDPVAWARHRKAELDWIWSEWQALQRQERQLEARLRRQLAAMP